MKPAEEAYALTNLECPQHSCFTQKNSLLLLKANYSRGSRESKWQVNEPQGSIQVDFFPFVAFPTSTTR